ncbi:MAG TPA: cyanophycin synthetase, partial [Methylotenera sp.]|nr:cyanophycin synthetase [Methylotenera sp.]
TPEGVISVRLPTPGLHNVMNALAATATALGMGASLKNVAEGLENYAGVKGRLQHLTGLNGALVVDDTYNANPMSMKAAIDVLTVKSGKKMLVLGDMGELGDDAAELHAEIGRYAKNAGVDALLTLGNLSQEMASAFGVGAQHYESVGALVADLTSQMQEKSTVLVKGSRFMAMERIVNEIISKSDSRNDIQKNGEVH